jgi:SAM-dependent methyltransferase
MISEAIYDTRFGIDSQWNAAVCVSCGLEQIFPVPSTHELQLLYENFYNFGGGGKGLYEELRKAFLFSIAYRIWMRLDGDVSFYSRRGRGRLLDVGCNEGRGLSFYSANGYEVEGLEISRVAARTAKSLGFCVHEESIDHLRSVRPYDVLVLSNVLEHSLDPAKMLKQAHRLLKPGGSLWISCPNSQSWLRTLLGRYWINWHVPFHISHFSSSTLSALLTRNGFKIKGIGNETPALWIAQSIVSRVCSRRGVPNRSLRNPLLVGSLMFLIRCAVFPLLWLANRNGNGDCLVVVAEKIEKGFSEK